jgi:hypothetical protein
MLHDALCPKCDHRSHFSFFFSIYTLFIFIIRRGWHPHLHSFSLSLTDRLTKPELIGRYQNVEVISRNHYCAFFEIFSRISPTKEMEKNTLFIFSPYYVKYMIFTLCVGRWLLPTWRTECRRRNRLIIYSWSLSSYFHQNFFKCYNVLAY